MTVETILKEVPLLETERFRLRDLQDRDVEDFFANFSDEETMRYFGMAALTEQAQAVKMMKGMEEGRQENSAIRWAIARREDDRLIGTIGFHNWSVKSFRAEVGYEINRAYWGQGVATEVLRAVLKCGYEEMGLNRIEAIVIPENLASFRVLEKVGFKKEGLLQEYMHYNDRYHDAVILALLKREFLV
ncbi:hypothetical protein CIG75_15720 [Tumebacillus algifaecis]|uniref:N-acetyltransferase domain-containing protein n=1 Tax=Tumebacillus algifaecis TaxID=1214604 RepID=A0A223D473_9BACL|nr:GNAT family N-acetyltransferase [Tumebacillus algifaecis]ASS76247.1 hypothetical protein CIG75_15720 [Tumebacillus algifaecis]